MPKVSVIVPVYKVAAYLDECVASILAQTHHDLEVILVDDGSPDACPAMCDVWAANDLRVRVVHKQNAGLSAARNTGLSVATGEWVLFVDSDDVVAPDLVALALARAEEVDAPVCVFKHCLFSDSIAEARPYERADLFPTETSCSAAEALEMLFSQRIHNYAQLHLVRRALYEKTGFRFPEGRSMEDLATTCLVLGSAERIALLDKPLYFYRQRAGSIVFSWRHSVSRDTHLALNDLLDYVRLQYPDLLMRAQNYALKMLFYCWKSESPDDPSGCSLSTRRAEVEQWIIALEKGLGFCSLTRSNKFKYIALRLGLLGTAARFHG